jgi:methionyl-tRNA formyltransferase
MKIGFLVSGNLGETVFNHFIDKENIQFVLTDKKSEGVIQLCKKNNIPVYIGNPRNNKIDKFIEGLECDVIASINYLFIVDNRIINCAKTFCFNVHGSLLPKYRGRTPHVWSIINGDKQTGITAHIIDEGCDTGPIIKQIKVDIDDDDTGGSILEKYRLLYVPLVEDVFKNLKLNNIEIKAQDEADATFFGKRTPEDGLINWNWEFQQIYNWVRAQSFPYPGAYTFYKKNKFIIDKVSQFSDSNHKSTENGTIISTNPLLVMCENSILKIDLIREKSMEFQVKDKLTNDEDRNS